MPALCDKDPFFIVYQSRSGSTFLSSELVAKQEIGILPETNFITMLIDYYGNDCLQARDDHDGILNTIYTDQKFHDLGISRQQLRATLVKQKFISIKDIVCTVLAIYKSKHYPKASIMGAKKGGYLAYSRQLKDIFTDAKFIGIIRDGRAVYNSQKHSIYSVTGKPFETSPYKAASAWCNTCRQMRQLKTDHPHHTMLVNYENIITNTVTELQKVSDFILPHSNGITSYSGNTYFIPARYGNLHKNITKKPLTSRIQAWRESLSPSEQYAYESVAYQALVKEGYSLVHSVATLCNPYKKLFHKIRYMCT